MPKRQGVDGSLWNSIYAHFVHFSKAFEASEIMKKNGSLALKAGEAKLALVFYHRAGDFAEYTTENITGSLDKDDKSAFALHDAKVGGFTDHIWRTTYFPSETEEKPSVSL